MPSDQTTLASDGAPDESLLPPRNACGVALCGTCTPASACRLGVLSERLEDDGSAVFSVVCPADQEGGPGVAHGGWTASVLDECLGHLPLLRGTTTVTAELTVSYVKPVSVGAPLEVRAWLDKQEGSRWFLRGELALLPGGAPLARASGIWVARDRSHFTRHQRWMAEQHEQQTNGEA
ncbi:PaaI family thioesterase [Streptomyces sp. KL116D]|uniref:PaaI family thioesterase n=1 Tax=Streptomyces sp. KL116D TaxID=3045152 RepID=UPI0035575C7C